MPSPIRKDLQKLKKRDVFSRQQLMMMYCENQIWQPNLTKGAFKKYKGREFKSLSSRHTFSINTNILHCEDARYYFRLWIVGTMTCIVLDFCILFTLLNHVYAIFNDVVLGYF